MKYYLLILLLLFSNLILADSIIIQTAGGVIEIDLADIANITFSEEVTAQELQNIFSKIPFSLLSNSPNPFNPSTKITFSLNSQTPEHTLLTIYNLKGQKVKQLVNATLPSGTHSYIWDGKDEGNKQVASGVYFYKLQINGQQKTKKMLLLK
jgi:hypothetical protein